MLITPPDALPNSADDEPRSTSIRSAAPSSRLVSCPWPSGSVWGMPSSSTLMPRTANAERAPNPRIEMRWSSEKLAVRGVDPGDRRQRLVEPPGGTGTADVGLLDQLDGERNLADRRIG